MSKFTFTRLASLTNAPATINGIITEIESAFDTLVSRDGAAPNQITADLDLNSKRILNLPAPVGATEPVTLSYFQATVQSDDAQLAANQAAASAATALTYKNAAQTAQTASEVARDLSQAWAESPTAPGGVGTKSSKTWAGESEGHEIAAAGHANDAETAKLGAEAARDLVLLSKGFFATPAAAIGYGVADYAALVGGSGGANGQFDLAFTGGTGAGAAGRFVVSGGAVIKITITAPGSYTAAPTPDFSASAGLTGASATLVLGRNVDVGEYFYTPAPNPESFIFYRVDAGPVATALGEYSFALFDAPALSSSVKPAGLITTRPKSYYFSASSLATGAVLADAALAGYLSNTAGSIGSNTFYTSASTKYFFATDVNKYFLKSLYRSTDMEVDSWTPNGRVYLRLDDQGKAIFFTHNNNTTNGFLQIGIVTGLNESNTTSTEYMLYNNADLVNNVSGYSKTVTDGHYFTFGVSGLEIYAKYNGVEICRFKDYRHYKEGVAACRSIVGNGVRFFNVRHLMTKTIYSDPKNNIIDMRDYGVRAVSGVGSISAASNILVTTSKLDLKKGDWVLVATGAEAGAGARGTVGVGGTWPSLSYADTATLLADNPGAGVFAWAQDTGSVWAWNGSAWSIRSAILYYSNMAVPLGLQAKITAISSDGLTITLDRNAVVSATNANVYFNNLPNLHIVLGRQRSTPGLITDYRNITPNNLTVLLPPGRLAQCGALTIQEKTGWNVVGNGTELFSPQGITPAAIFSLDCTDVDVSRVDITGNCGDSGFCLDMHPTLWWGGYALDGTINEYQAPSSVTQSVGPQSVGYTFGFLVKFGTRVTYSDSTVTNVFQQAFATSGCSDVWCYRITNNQIHLQHYVQWQFQFADSDQVGAVDCTINADQVISGFEFFQVSNGIFDRCKAYNALWSINNSGYVTSNNCMQRINGVLSASVGTSVPLANVNTNIGNTLAAMGCVFRNHVMIQDTYVDANNNNLKGIVSNVYNNNVRVEGGMFKCPDYTAPATNYGPIAVHLTGPDNIVDGMVCYGSLPAWALGNTGNIMAVAADGSKSSRAINCHANLVIADNLPTTVTTTTYTMGVGQDTLAFNPPGTCTLTLPNPELAIFAGRRLKLRNISAFAINSASSNVVPLLGGAAGTAILPSSGQGKWVDIESDGTQWLVVSGN